MTMIVYDGYNATFLANGGGVAEPCGRTGGVIPCGMET